jgi:hypothetical protein
VVDIQHLRGEAMRLHPIDAAAAQLLQRAGDEIQQLRIQRDALLQAAMPARATEVAHG